MLKFRTQVVQVYLQLAYFEAIHSYNVCRSPKSQKFTKTPYFEGSRSFKVIDVDTPKKLVTSACFDKQDVCAYLQLFSY